MPVRSGSVGASHHNSGVAAQLTGLGQERERVTDAGLAFDDVREVRDTGIPALSSES